MLSLLLFLAAAQPPALQFSVALPPGVQARDSAVPSDGQGLVVAGGDERDAIILRLAESGEMLWSKRLGGSGTDRAYAVAVDSNGDILVGGTTESADFPLLNPLINKANFEGLIRSRGFLTRLSADGRILYSTYYYTNGLLSITNIRILSSGEVVLAGGVGNPSTFGTASRGFVSKLTAPGDRVVFHTELSGVNVVCQGGSGCLPARPQTSVSQLDVRTQDGWILVGGSTNSFGMATEGAMQTECYCGWGGPVGWVGLLDASGKTRYVTYLSGRQIFAGGNIGLGLEQLWMASFDSEGQIRAAGNTRAFGFPTTAQAYQPAFELCEAVSFSAGICLPKAPLSYFTVLDGAGGKLRASTLYGGVAATLKGAIADPGGSIWMTGEREPFLDDRQPFLVLMKPDASGIEGSWPAPVGSYFLGSPIPGGFASVMLGGKIRLYRWQDQGPRIYALSGQIAPGETVDVYTAGSGGNQASLYFDGILAAADPVPGEPGHWKATVPEGITRDAIVDIALIADERLAITKVSSN